MLGPWRASKNKAAAPNLRDAAALHSHPAGDRKPAGRTSRRFGAARRYKVRDIQEASIKMQKQGQRKKQRREAAALQMKAHRLQGCVTHGRRMTP